MRQKAVEGATGALRQEQTRHAAVNRALRPKFDGDVSPLSTLSGLSPFASPRPSNGEKFTNASERGSQFESPLLSPRERSWFPSLQNPTTS